MRKCFSSSTFIMKTNFYRAVRADFGAFAAKNAFGCAGVGDGIHVHRAGGFACSATCASGVIYF